MYLRPIVIVLILILLPWQYDGQCLNAAEDIKKEFGGSISFIEPRYKNNSVIEGEIGHWINKIHGRYIDYLWQRIFNDQESVIKWYTNITGYENAYIVDQEGY